MQKISTALAALACGMALVATQAAARPLTVISWGGAYQDAQREIIFKPYAEKFGPMVDEAYNGELAKIKAMVAAGDTTWDVVQFEEAELENACMEGLVERLDWERLGGKDKMIPEAVMGDCGVGVIVYSVVMAYDKGKVGAEAPASWADFWNVGKWPGKRALRKTPKFTLEIALLADGVAPDQVYEVLATPEGVDRAFAKLDEIKGDIQWWESGAQPPQWLASGDVVMTSAYNGRISSAIAEGQDFSISWDGQVYTLDAWAIVSGTPELDAAYNFLDVALEPERQAQLAAVIPYGTTTAGASDLVAAEVLKDLPSNPDNMTTAVHQDNDFWIDHIEELNQRFNNWAAN